MLVFAGAAIAKDTISKKMKQLAACMPDAKIPFFQPDEVGLLS